MFTSASLTKLGVTTLAAYSLFSAETSPCEPEAQRPPLDPYSTQLLNGIKSDELRVYKAGAEKFSETLKVLHAILSDQGESGFTLKDSKVAEARLRVTIASDLEGPLSKERALAIAALTAQEFADYTVRHGIYFAYDKVTTPSGVFIGGFVLSRISSAPEDFKVKEAFSAVRRAMESRGFLSPRISEPRCFVLGDPIIIQDPSFGCRLGTVQELMEGTAIIIDQEILDAIHTLHPKLQLRELVKGVLANEWVHTRNLACFGNRNLLEKREVRVGGKAETAIWREVDEASSDLGSLLVTEKSDTPMIAFRVGQLLLQRGSTYRLSRMIAERSLQQTLGAKSEELFALSRTQPTTDPAFYRALQAKCEEMVAAHPKLVPDLIRAYETTLADLKRWRSK